MCIRDYKRLIVGALLGFFVVVAGPIAGQAQVVGLEILTTASPIFDGVEFGLIGPYERIDARADFAVDPSSPRVAGIVDIDKAPDGGGDSGVIGVPAMVRKPRSPMSEGMPRDRTRARSAR